jgi:hypothetical protein
MDESEEPQPLMIFTDEEIHAALVRSVEKLQSCDPEMCGAVLAAALASIVTGKTIDLEIALASLDTELLKYLAVFRYSQETMFRKLQSP